MVTTEEKCTSAKNETMKSKAVSGTTCVSPQKNIISLSKKTATIVNVLTEETLKENVAAKFIDLPIKSCSSTKIEAESEIIEASPRKMKNFNQIDFQAVEEENKSMAKTQGCSNEKKIMNINDLKKSTPRLRLPKDLSSSPSMERPTVDSNNEAKREINKYCRACAEIKYPLIDIYSEKGLNMKLDQQIEFLQTLHKTKSCLSTKLCMDCICDLRVCHSFFLQIKKAENKFNSMCSVWDKTVTVVKTGIKEKNVLNVAKMTNITEVKPKHELVAENTALETNSAKTNSTEKHGIDPEVPQNNSIDINEDSDEFNDDHFVLSISDDDDELKPDSNNLGCEGNNKIASEVNIAGNDEKAIETVFLKECTTLETSFKENVQAKIVPGILKKSSIQEPTKADAKKTTFKCHKIALPKLKFDSNYQKLQKIDIHNPLKETEDGAMYVTVKGTKPNEVLLVKVKKLEKSEKPVKRKLEPKSVDDKNNKIEMEIEQYKRKKLEVLDKTKLDVKKSKVKTNTLPNDSCLLEKDIAIKEESQKESESETKLKSRQPLLLTVDSNSSCNTKDLKVDSSQKLKELLKVSDDEIKDFEDHLKQRRIVVARLKNKDIISLYAATKKVTLEDIVTSLDIQAEEYEEKEEKELEKNREEDEEYVFDDNIPLLYDCDFCFESFNNREGRDEHLKTHNFKLQIYCDDCKETFRSLKAKKVHNHNCKKKFECSICKTILGSKGKKKRHEQKHCDDENGVLCEVCGDQLKNSITLDQHYKSKHKKVEKTYECNMCKKLFAYKTKLTFHMKSVHTDTRAFLCEDCGADFKNPASLRHHRVRKHINTNSKRECPVCHKLVPRYGLSKHMYTHKDFTIKCPYCPKMFKNSSTLKQHTRIHEDHRQFKCVECGVGFNRRDGLKLHMKVHDKSDGKTIKECSCTICGEKFPSHSMLVLHRNRIHKDSRTFSCHFCNRSMISERSLEWHLSQIHGAESGFVKDESSNGGEANRVTCRLCDKTFKTDMILRTHIKNTHSIKEPIKCTDCDVTFTSETRLRHHMMVEHDHLDGTITCPHCPKRFVNTLRLKTHMISHSDERPFTCATCGFTLKTKIQLIKHNQNRHSNERPLKCSYCPWRCKQVSALVCHERTHTNERPYNCKVCNQRFKYLGDKNKHEKRHEILGGSGFKRIVTGRNNVKSGVKTQKSKDKLLVKNKDTKKESNAAQTNQEDCMHDKATKHLENIDPNLIKFESPDMMEEYDEGEEEIDKLNEIDEAEANEVQETDDADEAETAYERIYFEQFTQEQEIASTPIIIGVEGESSMYTEEVTADSNSEIITSDIDQEELLRPGTVVHIEQCDENGKIQVIPVVLSLSDNSNQIDLNTSTIVYN